MSSKRKNTVSQVKDIARQINRRLEERAAIRLIKEDMQRRKEANKVNGLRKAQGKVFKPLSRYNKDHILALGAEGKNLADIGAIYGVSRQRMYQVVQKLKIDKKCYGKQKDFPPQKKIKKSDLELQQRLKFSRKKSFALAKGYAWSIEYNDVIWPIYCPILGIELDYFADKATEESVSFDQLIPGEGYTKDNLVIMSWRANRIKNDGTAEEHRKIYEFILDNT